MSFKIYTKTGDNGTTGLLGGTRVPKHHIRIETYGTLDELNSWLGLIRDGMPGHAQVAILAQVQDMLFRAGSLLAADPEKNKMALPALHAENVEVLERAIDEMDAQLPPLKSFVLPGGHALASQLHIARCVCRRAERNLTHLAETDPVPPFVGQYLNRLSDYLFTLARYITWQAGAKEVEWHAPKDTV
jgi:cob(I)alamin adenosyltransferase